MIVQDIMEMGGVLIQDIIRGGVIVQNTMGGRSDSSGHHGRGE